jgi:hypothetical protein
VGNNKGLRGPRRRIISRVRPIQPGAAIPTRVKPASRNYFASTQNVVAVVRPLSPITTDRHHRSSVAHRRGRRTLIAAQSLPQIYVRGLPIRIAVPNPRGSSPVQLRNPVSTPTAIATAATSTAAEGPRRILASSERLWRRAPPPTTSARLLPPFIEHGLAREPDHAHQVLPLL